jgi:hypothetical protein
LRCYEFWSTLAEAPAALSPESGGPGRSPGLTSKTIRRWEQDLAIPRSFAKLQLARFFDLPPEELFEDLEPSTALPWTVPFPRHSFFTGREQILRALSTRLTVEQPIALTQTLALSGLGGIGKTQVAIEYAYRFASEYRAVFWLEAQTRESLMRSLVHIAEQLQLPEREAVQQAQMVGAACHASGMVAHR